MNVNIKRFKRLLLLLMLGVFIYTIFLSNKLFSQSRAFIKDTPIIDTEILNFLDELLSLITDREDMHLYVISNNNFNAMATSKNTISIYSGVFERINDVEVLLAIIAHELGHVSQNHLIRLQKKLDGIKLQNVISGLISVAAVIAMAAGSASSNYTVVPTLAPYLITDVSTKDILAYTRSEESLADQFMLTTFLNKKISLNEYINFVSNLAKEDDAIYSVASGYLSDHPRTSDRLFDIKQRLSDSKIKLSELKRLPYELSVKYKMVQAKIYGLMNTSESIIAKYSEQKELDTPYYFYALAVSNWFNRNYKEALNNFNIILNQYLNRKEYQQIINSGYIFEGLAETYFLSGNMIAAIKNYEYALKKLTTLPRKNEKNLQLVKQSFANVLISSDDDNNINRGIEILRQILLKEKRTSAYYYLSIAYGKIKDTGRAHYYLAKYFEAVGDLRKMKIHIEKSENDLSKSSIEYQDLMLLKNDN